MLDSTKGARKSLLTPRKPSKTRANGAAPDSSTEPKSSVHGAGSSETNAAALPSPLDGIGGMGKNIGNGLQNGMGDLGNSMKSLGADSLGNFQRNMGSFGSDVKNGLGSLGGNLNSAFGSLSDGVTSSVNHVHTAASNATNAAANAATSNDVLGLRSAIAAPPPLRLPFRIPGISPEKSVDTDKSKPTAVDEAMATFNFLTTSSPIPPKAPKASNSSSSQKDSPVSAVNIPKHSAPLVASAASPPPVQQSPKLLPKATASVGTDKGAARRVDIQKGLEQPAAKQGVTRAGDIGTEIGDIIKEIHALTVAFDEERSFLTAAYNRCTLLPASNDMDFVVL
jgi:hypothetical protein